MKTNSDEIRKEYRKSRRPNEENSSSPSRGHSEDQQPKRDRFRVCYPHPPTFFIFQFFSHMYILICLLEASYFVSSQAYCGNKAHY